MIQNYLKQFSSGTVKMLQVRSDEPFKILNKLNCNTYVINLLRDHGTRTFNVNDLVDYKNFNCSTLIDKPSLKSFSESSSLSLTPKCSSERVDKILEDVTTTTKSGETHKYLIC